jgi:dihydroxyacetone kinase
LYGAWITSLGQALGEGEPDTVSVARALEASLDTLKRLGGAEPGDKTMIDALKPFVRAFSGAAEGGSGTSDAWSRALPAASEGAEATSGMVSTKGRSSKLGERSRGHKDPGAASRVLILSAAGEALAEGSKQEASRQDRIPGSEEGMV